MDPKSRVLYRYPFPIAVTYLNADNAREVVGAHDQRLKLFEVTLKFLSSIAIAQYVNDRLDDPRVSQSLRGLARPSLGQWNGFLREILSAYKRGGRVQDMFLPDLDDAYNKRRSDRPAMAEAYNQIRNYVENRTDSAVKSLSVRQFCDGMVNYRNKTIGHGAITRYHCERINEPLFDALEEMLLQLDFLPEHRLVYIEDVRVRRGSYAHEMMSYMGSTPPARMKEAYVTDQQSEYRVEEQLYLCARGENVPVLSLHPLIIAWQGDVLFLNESERERGIEYLSYQSGQIKKPDRLLEDFKEILGFVLGDERPDVPFERMRQQAIVPEVEYDAFEQAQRALEAEDWDGAIGLLERIPEDDSHYADAQTSLAHARQHKDWQERYRQGQQWIVERKWDQARQALESVVAEAGEYQDIQGLLQTIRLESAQDESLQRLYEYAIDALETSQWERAYDLLNRIHDLRSDFRDVSTLLARQKRLHDLYDSAIEAMSERHWVEAQAMLSQIQALEPGYKNLASLVERAEGELESESQLSSWYSKAKSHIALEEWNEALELLDQVYDRDQEFRDVATLLEQVRTKILIPCPSCGVLTPAGYKFCGKCGSAIASWNCWRCQSPVPEGRKFCGKCGAPRIEPSEAACPKCGSRNPTGRKFCSRCGEPLAQ